MSRERNYPLLAHLNRNKEPGAIVQPDKNMMTFILWLILLFFSWPLALLAIIAYPFIWLALLPFRLVGIAVDGVLSLIRALILLPARVLGGRG